MTLGKCDECVFFEQFDFNDEGDQVGTCLRFPPVYVKEDPSMVSLGIYPCKPKVNDPRNWQQPIVIAYWKCGEFRKKERKQ